MAERQWTPRQRDAIEARGGTVLVSAAAGSGKTAVLVERAVGRILDPGQPVDADRLLVVTFSNAAALEMKQRIMARVAALAAEHPENARLRRQQLLLGRAQISTIHAFCSELIRQNFQLLGIASNIRTGDEKELEVLRRDCARGVVEEFFAREDGGRFARLVELLSTGRDDSRVFTTLFSLYDFVRSHPFYHGWMEAKLSYYNEGVPVADSIWGKCILGYAADALGHACALCGRALSLVEEDETLSNAYGGALRADLRQLERVRESVAARDWDGTCKRLGSFVFEKLRPVRGDDPRKGAAQALRKSVRGIVETLRDRQFCATAAEFSEDVADLRPMVETLFELVEAFDRAFTEQKRQKNLMDFSDMEQYAIALLVRPAGEGYVKTPLARAVSERYDEVLVDEFQDTNAAQEIIFRAVSQKERNLFLVGDVKQSIYRFRQACPELFMEKKKRYAPYDGKQFPAKITLGKNFRSAPEVTGSVNFLFSLLMSEEIGEIDYNEEEALIPGGSFPEGTPAGCGLRLLDLTGYAGERTRAQVEADYVADEIAGMLGRGELVAEGDALRKIRPSDVCILLRSPSGRAQTYLEALQKRGVPVWAEPKSGFLTSKEVAPVVALLRVIDNPLLDVDLAAAMMSALFDFTADEMAHIRLADRRAPLYTAVQRRAGEGDAHCLEFCGTLARLRRFAAGATADAVIRRVYDECGCLAKAQVMRMGASRRANLLLLVQYACDYHASGYRGLSGFVGFVDRLIERGGDFAPAASLSEQADVVRIMSIHRSKGLEFPVVFLCDCAKQFNRQDLNGTTLLHTELGFACVRRDPKLQTQFSTVPMQALRLAIERSMLSEELRVLYVALTRAKQRLILTGTLTRPGEKLAGLACAPEGNGKLPPYQVRGAASYLDWVLMAAVHHPGAAGLLAQYGVEAGAVPAQAAFSAAVLPVGGDPLAAGETTEETPPPPGAHRGAGAAARLALSLRARDADPHQDGGFADLQGGARQKLPLRGTARLFAGAGTHRRAAWQRAPQVHAVFRLPRGGKGRRRRARTDGAGGLPLPAGGGRHRRGKARGVLPLAAGGAHLPGGQGVAGAALSGRGGEGDARGVHRPLRRGRKNGGPGRGRLRLRGRRRRGDRRLQDRPCQDARGAGRTLPGAARALPEGARRRVGHAGQGVRALFLRAVQGNHHLGVDIRACAWYHNSVNKVEQFLFSPRRRWAAGQ